MDFWIIFWKIIIKFDLQHLYLPQIFWRSIISPYNNVIPATHAKVTSPVICSACIIASLGIGATTVAEGAMRLLCFLTNFTLNTTICGVSDLCVMQCRLLFNLLLDQCKCIHCSTPKVVGFLGPFL